MPELQRPAAAYRDSFLSAMAEFDAERSSGTTAAAHAQHTRSQSERFAADWATPEGFARYLAELRGQERVDWQRPQGYVPATTLWWVSRAEYLGRVSIRHRLTPHLLELGGHIGYDVRPSARGVGTPPPCCGPRCHWRGVSASARRWSPVRQTTSARGR